MKFKSIALAIVVSMVSTVAMADLYTADLAVSGDRLLTVDTQTNLQWLNLSQTRGLSLGQVSAGGWFDQGFRLATETQVVDLMQSISPIRALALGAQSAPNTSGNVTLLKYSLVGAVAGDPEDPRVPILVKTFEYGRYLSPPQGGSEPVPGDRGWWCTPETGPECIPTQPVDEGGQHQTGHYEVFASTLSTWLSTQDSTPGASVFLVKDVSAVPEPAAWLLMGIGLVGLFGVSRRRQPN